MATLPGPEEGPSSAEIRSTEPHQNIDTPVRVKIDKITALQDGIGEPKSEHVEDSLFVYADPSLLSDDNSDGLSLAMFEALRGLRDAVAPESGNLGGGAGNNSNNENSEPDFEDFWQSYRNHDPETVSLVRRVAVSTPKSREDFLRIHAKVEMEKDAELVKKLASTVLEKSAEIDERVSGLPGMHRTRTQQMKYIEELLAKNSTAAEKLEATYDTARQRRDLVRKFVRENTCDALGIVEDTD